MKFDANVIKNKIPMVKRALLGNSWKSGILSKILIYTMLVLFGFVFLFPLFYMLSYSLMSPSDVVNPFVTYLPTTFYFENIAVAFHVLDYVKTLLNSLILAIITAALQCIATAVIGYGLAQFRIPGKTLILVLILATFIIPPQITMIPQYLIYKAYNLQNVFVFFTSAILGQGVKSPIFILIFYQFFRSMPKALEEAAKIDGANPIKIFIFIACPLAVSGFILTFLFTFVWVFNETTLTSIFLGSSFSTLPLQLEKFKTSFDKLYPSDSGRNLNEAIFMGGTFLSILPLLIIYFVLQRYFIESIDKAGITGE